MSETFVRELLTAAGLRPDEAEIRGMIDYYPVHQRGVEALYALPEARYETPALVFDPEPTFSEWSR